MPLQQHEITREICRELETEPMERTRKIVVRPVYLSNIRWSNVGTIWVVGILGSSIQQIRYELKAILLEAITARDTSTRNWASIELKMAPVVCRQYYFDVNLLTLSVLRLRSRTHWLTKDIQVAVVIVACLSRSTLSCCATFVETLRIIFLGVVAGCSSRMDAVRVSYPVASSYKIDSR